MHNIFKFLVALANLFFMGLHKKDIHIYRQSIQRENICGLLYMQLNVYRVTMPRPGIVLNTEKIAENKQKIKKKKKKKKRKVWDR